MTKLTELTKHLLALTLLAVVTLATMPTQGHASPGFRKWVKDFYSIARKNGITRRTYNKAFDGIRSVDPEIIQLTRFQPEFRQQMWMYFDSRVNEDSIERGREERKRWSKWLSRIEKSYGVDRDILLAIWSMESTYGEAMKKPKAMRSVIRSLATLAYKDRKRRKFARRQLIAAMKILQSGKIEPRHLRGSWAGAMGQTQFIPSSYRLYAQDIDRDGRADIWDSVPDALATAANLLRKNGWRTGQTWGYEVIGNARARKYNGKTKTIAQWRKLGIKRVKGKSFRHGKLRARMMFPAGKNGPAFLMLKNFFVIKKYNNATKYALAVGHLADQIAGYGEFEKTLPRPYRKLTKPERLEIQTHLARLGLYEGEIDGKIGSGTRAAIRKAQDRLGMNPDGYESPKLLSRLKHS